MAIQNIENIDTLLIEVYDNYNITYEENIISLITGYLIEECYNCEEAFINLCYCNSCEEMYCNDCKNNNKIQNKEYCIDCFYDIFYCSQCKTYVNEMHNECTIFNCDICYDTYSLCHYCNCYTNVKEKKYGLIMRYFNNHNDISLCNCCNTIEKEYIEELITDNYVLL